MAQLDDLVAQQAVTDPNAPGVVRPLAPPAPPVQTPPAPDITQRSVKTTPETSPNALPFWPDQQDIPSIFIPASANRAPREWKDKPWNVAALENSPNNFSTGAYAPSPWENFGVLHGTGSSMSRWGSPTVQQHASQVGSLAGGFAPLLDLLSSGKFSQNFNAAQTRRLQNQLVQIKINAELAEQAHRQQAEFYGGILEEGTLGAITPHEAEERMLEYANTNDPILAEIIKNKGLGAATRFLQWRDAQMNDMLAASTSLKRATGVRTDAELDEEWGITPGQGGGTGGRYPMIPGTDIAAPAATPGRPAPPPVAQADPTATASSAQTDADTPPPEDDADKFFEDLKKGDPSQGRAPVSDQQLDMAKQMLDGPPSDTYKDLSRQGTEGHRIKAGIDSAYSALRGKLGRIADDPRYKSNQDKLDAMAKYAPAQSARLRGFLSYDTDLDKEGIKTRDQDRAMLLRLNPHWNENGFRIKQEWNSQNKPSAIAIGRASSLVQAQEDTARSLLAMPLDRPNLVRDFDQWVAHKWTGDPRFDDEMTNIQNVLTDSVTIQTGSRPAVNLVNSRLRHMFSTMSPAQILIQLQDDSRAAYSRVMGYNYTFQSAIGDPTALAPGYNRLTDDRYKSFILMNPYTQTMPADAPPSALAGSRPIGSEKLPGYVRKGIDDYPPLRLDHVDKARAFVNDPKNKNSTDPKVQANIAYLRKLLGPLADPDPWNYVGPR